MRKKSGSQRDVKTSGRGSVGKPMPGPRPVPVPQDPPIPKPKPGPGPDPIGKVWVEIGEPTWLERKNMPQGRDERKAGESAATYLMEFQIRTRLEGSKRS